MKQVFSQKYVYVGDDGLRALIAEARDKAQAYRLPTLRNEARWSPTQAMCGDPVRLIATAKSMPANTSATGKATITTDNNKSAISENYPLIRGRVFSNELLVIDAMDIMINA